MRTDEYRALIAHTDSAIGSIRPEIRLRRIRVPLIARWPGQIQCVKVSDEFTSTLEFYPSFLAAAGTARPSTPILPVLQGTAKAQRKEFFWEDRNARAARVGQWKWAE